jgi:hypothetical protein
MYALIVLTISDLQHYLVAEYLMIAPADLSPEDFYALTKRQQADLIWDALFIQRSPVSEACRGVVTTLVRLGLQRYVCTRDLDAIRAWYRRSYPSGQECGAEEFSALVHSLAGVRYNIMTNIPFNPDEAKHWRDNKSYCRNYRSALRVDPLLMGDTATIEQSLALSGYDRTLSGARQYLRDWCDVMKPEYVMASTSHDFAYGKEFIGPRPTLNMNEDAMRQPGAFAVAASAATSCCPESQEEFPSLINESSKFLSEVLMQVCEERDLPIALKIGAHRGVNPALRAAGDGVVAFADTSVLARLCSTYPKVRFLATFLSLNNQHEACVLASKFRNLHLYGCWWFCNNPSIIQTITKMRIEMLGTSFTAQHSDARVLDQLLYKWPHARYAIAGVLQEEYLKLLRSGWSMTRGEVRRDVERLFGKSYDEFMQKSLLT